MQPTFNWMPVIKSLSQRRATLRLISSHDGWRQILEIFINADTKFFNGKHNRRIDIVAKYHTTSLPFTLDISTLCRNILGLERCYHRINLKFFVLTRYISIINQLTAEQNCLKIRYAKVTKQFPK